MRRLSLMLVAAVAVASFVTQPAAAQFQIPKIKIPKIPKTTDAPTTTTTSNPDRTVSSTPVSTSSASSGEVRGTPLRGARITFSNNPDGSNPKTTFTSSEYIYGRLDLGAVPGAAAALGRGAGRARRPDPPAVLERRLPR